MIGLCSGKKQIMGKDVVRERGKSSSGTALTSVEENREGKSEKGCKWTSVTSRTHMAESPFSVTTEVKAGNTSVHLFPHFWPVILLQGLLPELKEKKCNK